MFIESNPSTGPERTVTAFSDDRLLLEEANHRMLNELAAAIAALQLIRTSSSLRGRSRLLVEAIARLEGLASAQRLLSGPTRTSVNVSREAEALCHAMVTARPGMHEGEVRLDLPDLWIDGATARRLLLVAAELIGNALRHAFATRPGRLEVGLSVEGTDAMLVVADDGPGIAAAASTPGTGLGTPIVRELVGRVGGRIACDSSPKGTVWSVAIPLDLSAMTRVQSHG